MSASRQLSSVFIGSGSTLIHCAERFVARGHRLLAVISADEAVQLWADGSGVPTLPPGTGIAERLRPLAFDLLFSIVHLNIVADEILMLPRLGAINFHDGILPDDAGLNVPAWSILRGAREHGISWHLMTAGIDEGDLLKQQRFPIDSDETALSLNAKCYQAALTTFEALVAELEQGRMTRTPQVIETRRVYRRHQRPPAAGSIDWSQTADAIGRLVRALDFGPYANPLTTAKAWIGGTPITVGSAEVLAEPSILAPGTVTELGRDSLTVATGSADIRVGGFSTPLGTPVTVEEMRVTLGLREGTVLSALGAEVRAALDTHASGVARHETFWRQRLRSLTPLDLPYARRQGGSSSAERTTATLRAPVSMPAGTEAPGDRVLVAAALYLGRIGGSSEVDLAYREEGPAAVPEVAALLSDTVPLRVSLDPERPFASFSQQFLRRLTALRRRGRYPLELVARDPELAATAADWHRRPPPVLLERVGELGQANDSDSALTLSVPDDGRFVQWHYRTDSYSDETIARMQAQFDTLLDGLADEIPLGRLPLLPAAELDQLQAWNRTERSFEAACIHRLFEAQVARTPDRTALRWRTRTLTYAELNRKANRVAQLLIADGVGPGDLIGVLIDRRPEMMTALLGILKAGAAYVPLDPTYPRDRLQYMVEDAGLRAVLTEAAHADLLATAGTAQLVIDRLAQALAQQPDDDPATAVGPSDLAYVIYTSGSTGRPKGVMVEHRNAANFFAAMDDRIGTEPGVWLAVTSISFDISVLELFWTLARGFEVVLYDGDDREAAGLESAAGGRELGFSLFYFASDEGEEGGRAKYELLLEGARFADRNGFEAVWTPERHFHAFGGLYPNPSVAGAAIAAITERVQIRAGSCVLPLHNPIRVAEEWALVDNLSDGRVGISFATGWQPNDFVLAPDNYEGRYQAFDEGIDTVRALWRGEHRTFPGPKGEVEIRTLPRPVQAELPYWVTAAGNPETFRRAGVRGANLLTHLLGQSVDELADKIALYRQAWRDAGHEGEGRVTLMLHSFVAEDEAFVREQAYGPLKGYLRSASNLVKQYASTFPAFRHAKGAEVDDLFQRLSEEDMEALLDHAVERYYRSSGLFGTPESCQAMITRVGEIGVDEVACLIDFGIPSATVRAQLPQLDALRRLATAPATPSEAYGIPALLEQHGVTHMQCTPTLATMLSKNRRARSALRGVGTLMVGGEAFPPELARDLRDHLPGRLLNMYGPTETTIWSTVHELERGGAGTDVPIGRPIANTSVHIVDDDLNRLPLGLPGELLIGGAGVVRGYLGRDEQTAERFVTDRSGAEARLYRTGDLVRWRDDGTLAFLGRRDHQVKIRGYRIELGEIEAALGRLDSVQQAVVVALGAAAGERRLVAYLVPAPGRTINDQELRSELLQLLPEFMVPAIFVTLERFPLTPNGKIDRKALPAPTVQRPDGEGDYAPPRTEAERALAEIFAGVLELERVGVHDNFIALGGDSLAAVEVVLEVEQRFGVEFPMYMFFQVLTVERLATELERMVAEAPNRPEALPIEEG